MKLHNFLHEAQAERDRLPLFLLVCLCALTITSFFAYCSDYDLSDDHDSPDITLQTSILIDQTSSPAALLKFVNQSIILSSVYVYPFLTRAPPA